MSENERDNHFTGFATLLFAELRQEEMKSRPFHSLSDFDAYQLRAERIIAQRAYDLVKYTIQEATDADAVVAARFNFDDYAFAFPDMTEWPEH